MALLTQVVAVALPDAKLIIAFPNVCVPLAGAEPAFVAVVVMLVDPIAPTDKVCPSIGNDATFIVIQKYPVALLAIACEKLGKVCVPADEGDETVLNSV